MEAAPLTDQKALHNAFLWALQVYEEARYLLEDAMGYLEEQGLSSWSGGWYSAYKGTLAPREYPFVYLSGQLAAPEEEHHDPGVGVLIFVSFHAERFEGPMLLLGTCRWSDGEAYPDHWLINVTARCPGYDGRFESVAEAGVWVHTPTARGRLKHVGIEEVRHVEVPLTLVRDHEQLHGLLDALVEMREGDEARIREMCGAMVG